MTYLTNSVFASQSFSSTSYSMSPVMSSVAMHVEALSDCCQLVRRNAVRVLSTLGAMAKPALNDLENAIRNELKDDVRFLMAEAHRKISSGI